jgi:hypothetical protein
VSDDDGTIEEQLTLIGLPKPVPMIGYDEEHDPKAFPTLPDPGGDVGHAIGHNHPATSHEAEANSRGQQAKERAWALSFLHTVGERGCTVAECADPALNLYTSRNQCSISFIWMRRSGWARRVLVTDPRAKYSDEKPKGRYVSRMVGPHSSGVVHVMTEKGRMEYARRYLGGTVS